MFGGRTPWLATSWEISAGQRTYKGAAHTGPAHLEKLQTKILTEDSVRVVAS